MTSSFYPTKIIIAAFCASLGLAGARAATLKDLTYVQVVGHVPLERQIAAARALGIGKVRLAIRWSDVEKGRKQWDWRATDARFRSLKQAGMVPMITLYGSNKAYPHQEGVRGAPSNADAVAGFASFAAAAAERYGTGTNAAPIYYEIWNEPNTKTFWGRPPEPEAYAQLAAQACEAIRKAKPAAQVLVLAMEGTPVKTPYFVKDYGLDIYQQWAGRAASPALMGCADGISFHPYLPLPEFYHRDEPALQSFLARHWDKKKPPIVANTEWGYSIDRAKGRTEQRQAMMDLRALLLGAGKHRPTNLYMAVNGGKDDKPDQSYGLFDFAGKPKPAGVAIERLFKAIGDYTIDGVESLPDKANAYRFSASKGNARALIFWASEATATAEVAPSSKATDLLTGDQRPIENGKVQVTTAPVLVQWTR